MLIVLPACGIIWKNSETGRQYKLEASAQEHSAPVCNTSDCLISSRSISQTDIAEIPGGEAMTSARTRGEPHSELWRQFKLNKKNKTNSQVLTTDYWMFFFFLIRDGGRDWDRKMDGDRVWQSTNVC